MHFFLILDVKRLTIGDEFLAFGKSKAKEKVKSPTYIILLLLLSISVEYKRKYYRSYNNFVTSTLIKNIITNKLCISFKMCKVLKFRPKNLPLFGTVQP